MLDATWTLNYTVDGVAAATNVDFAKRAHELQTAEYREVATVNDPALPTHQIKLRTEDPKRSKTSYGTRRNFFNLRREFEVTTPSGETTLAPVVIKIESSIPVGIDLNTITSVISEVSSAVSSSIFARFTKTQET